jgi:hypothetical protein
MTVLTVLQQLERLKKQSADASKPEETMEQTVARLEKKMGCKIVAAKGERKNG